MSSVSILVPVYKAEKYIERCTVSLFAQTYPDLEFVFIDDCSPDKSIEVLLRVLEAYPKRKERTRIIRNENNLGAAASKNIAISNATGTFICFVDADDWIELDAIEKLIGCYESTRADVIWGQMDLYTKDGIVTIAEPRYKDKHEWLTSYIGELCNEAYLSNSRRIIRRELVESNHIRMERGLNYSEDRLFMTRVAYYAQSFSIMDETVYHYNKINQESQTEKRVDEAGLVNRYGQIIGNLQNIEDFFSGKEREYYVTAVTTKLKVLKNVMDTALRYPSRKLFRMAVSRINGTDPAYWYVIDWNRSKAWRVLHSNYVYRRLLPSFRSLLNRIKNN